MATIIADGKIKVWWVPTIANQAAPTVAELAAGTVLSTLMTADGLIGFEPDTAAIDTTTIESTFDTVTAGRAAYSGCAVRLQKQATTDAVYAALVRDSAGYIVIRRDLAASTAAASTQKAEVYPSVLGETKNLAPEKNSLARYEVPVMVTAAPTIRAVIAA
jgi:hypothetical protein